MIDNSKYINNFSEYNKALAFLKTGCECGCSSKVPHERFAQLRAQFQNLDKPAQDAFVMGQLFAMDEGETTTSSRFPKRERTNNRTFYRWNNRTPLCLKTYLNLLGVSRNYLECIRNLLLLDKGLVSRVHGNTNRMPQWKSKMAISQKVKKMVKKFIESYSEEHGLPDPGKSKNQKHSVIFLPTEMSYKSVHRDLLTSLNKRCDLEFLRYEAFRRLWHQLTPNIKFMSPRTDLCDTCHQLRNEIHACKDEIVKQTQKKNFLNIRKERS